MALVTYAEAAGEGDVGLQAVMHVIHNRAVDARFPNDICAVVLAPGQFQPVGENPGLRRVLQDPEAFSLADAFPGRPVNTVLMNTLLDAARRHLRWKIGGKDPTVGALFFVNPALMDLDKCPWFATLERTAVIGHHVFMNHRQTGARSGPALDCASLTVAREAGRTYTMAEEGPRPEMPLSRRRVTLPGHAAPLAPTLLPDRIRTGPRTPVRSSEMDSRARVAAKLDSLRAATPGNRVDANDRDRAGATRRTVPEIRYGNRGSQMAG